jgi:hypothetical protein
VSLPVSASASLTECQTSKRKKQLPNWNPTTNNKKLDRKGQRKLDAFAVFHVFQIMSEASETSIFITVVYLR